MILDRGERLDSLENKSDELSKATLVFKKQARKLKPPSSSPRPRPLFCVFKKCPKSSLSELSLSLSPSVVGKKRKRTKRRRWHLMNQVTNGASDDRSALGYSSIIEGGL